MLRVFALLLMLLGLSVLASPQARAAGDEAAAQNVISSQIEAFLHDDMDAAYSFASPGIKQMFPTPGIFFDMVKRGYAPVYRPGNYAFGRFKVDPATGLEVQEVLIHAPDGTDWTALYMLQRQPDGSLKISGVHMIKSAPPSA